jgi:hypothetical protein
MARREVFTVARFDRLRVPAALTAATVRAMAGARTVTLAMRTPGPLRTGDHLKRQSVPSGVAELKTLDHSVTVTARITDRGGSIEGSRESPKDRR